MELGAAGAKDHQSSKDVENKVTAILNASNGVITGGALGVDYIATAIAMKLNPKLNKLKYFYL